jgi:methyltransferase
MSQEIFTVIVIVLAVQRLLELRLSRRHEARILAQGGREHASGHFGVMKAVHTGWFAAMLIEVFRIDRPFIPWLAAVAFIVFLMGQGLRYAAILTLGWRWSVRIMTLPGTPPVTQGIYRYVRHPNYLGVMLEIAAVPLLHTAYLTAICFTVANAALLFVRIRAEEQALNTANDYLPAFADRPRFIPRKRKA